MPFDASVDESLCYKVEVEVSTDSRDETRPLIEEFLGRDKLNTSSSPPRGKTVTNTRGSIENVDSRLLPVVK
jgi:hypothetical protein